MTYVPILPDEKQEVVDGVVYRYSTEWIHSLESEFHWQLYWQQQKIMQNLIMPGEHVLELGVGSGFTANYLKSKGIRVTTIDIDEEKNPDIVGNIVTYKFKNDYDHILAFEVLEHIPFDQVEILLPKLSAVCDKNFFISVPMNRTVLFYLNLKLPKMKEISWGLTRKKGRLLSEHHFWEIGFQSITEKKLEGLFVHSGYQILASEKVFPAHAFYVLENR